MRLRSKAALLPTSFPIPIKNRDTKLDLNFEMFNGRNPWSPTSPSTSPKSGVLTPDVGGYPVSSALSRLPFSRSSSGACQSAAPCSAVSQVAPPDAQFLYAFDAADSSRQIGAEEAAVRRLLRQTPNCAQTEVDRARGQMSGFKMHSTANDDRLVESEPWLRP